MRIKRLTKRFTSVLCSLVIATALMGLYAAPAFAFDANSNGATSSTGTGEAEQNGKDASQAQTEQPTSTPRITSAPTTTSPVTLTPEGNLTLVDDIAGEAATDKQFVTVTTKSGNYFYLVIDRASTGQNVYFLNLVDESDLLALLKDSEVTTATAPALAMPEPTPQEIKPEVIQEPQADSGGIGVSAALGIVALLALAAGGAVFYLKVLKPKRKSSGRVDISELDAYGYGADTDLDDLIAEAADEYVEQPERASYEADSGGGELTAGADYEPDDGDEDELAGQAAYEPDEPMDEPGTPSWETRGGTAGEPTDETETEDNR